MRRAFFGASLGPGLLLAATSIGASHLLMSPEAGARFEYSLVWLVLAVHVLKYPAFEFAPRYVAARGESLLAAYARAGRWALWLGIGDMTIQAVGLIAALVGLTASFLVISVGGLSLVAWSLVLTAALILLLVFGRYRALRAVNIFLLMIVAVGTLIALAGAPPAPGAVISSLVRPTLPDGSLVLVAAILGFMPTSVAVSIWHSLWALEHNKNQPMISRATDAVDDPAMQAIDRTPVAPLSTTPHLAASLKAAFLKELRRGLFDLRLGYGLSAGLAAVFVCLGATVLYPRGLVPQGTDVALTLSRLYTEVLGEWMRPMVLVMAFAALFTTCYTMMDGFPRSFVAARRALASSGLTGSQAAAASDATMGRSYWLFLAGVTGLGMAILAVLPDPATLVKGVGALGLLSSPIYYTLNLWAVTRLIDDPRLRPGPGLVALSIAGILAMIGTAGLLLWTTLQGLS